MEAAKLKEILGIEGDEQDEKIEAAIAAIDEETDALVRTKDKLRQQVKDLDKRLKAVKDIDPDEVDQMRTELEELRDAAEAGDGEQTRKISAEERKAIEERATRKIQDQLDALQTRFDDVSGKYHGSLKEGALRTALQGLNLRSKAFEDTLFKSFLHDTKVDEIDGELVVHLKNKDGLDLPPEEYFADWAKTDSAKEFIKAPDNSGGGARGGDGGNPNSKTMPRAQFDAMSEGDKHTFMSGGGRLTD